MGGFIMETGVSSYSFMRSIHQGELDQLSVIRKAKEMGFDAIEFAVLQLPQGETPLSFAPKLKEECHKVGIKIVNYAVSADFLNGSGGDLNAEIERTKEEVKVAKILGCPVMRHDAAWGFPKEHKGKRNFEDALPRLIAGCKAVTEFAADLGIKTTIENHGFFCQDSERVEQLINGVNHPNFGLLLDIGNFLCVDENPGQAVGRLAPYAFHVHVKDFHVKPGTASNPGEGWFRSRGGNYLRGAVIGHGEVPVIQCLHILKNSGYDGTISIEFEGLEDSITGVGIGKTNLSRYIKEVF